MRYRPCQKGSNGLPCGGKEHGECKCDGTCECKEGWKGDACECSTDQSTCYKPEELGITGFKFFVFADYEGLELSCCDFSRISSLE